MQPRVLVTSAAGHTGSCVVRELLERGYPVRAFVRRIDDRADRLRSAGAELFVGNLYDTADVRRALSDVQRAYYCPPFGPNLVHGSLLFAIAAEEAKLEMMAYLSAWNPHPGHPSIHQREHWIANNVIRWMPSVNVVYLNPGLFAFTYFFGLADAAHFGQLMLPYGDGLNAPPSNEDIAAVAAGVIADPAPHIGQHYRPTGPRLLSGHDVAATFARIFGRPVRYRNVSTWLFTKAAKVMGFSTFEIAQIRHYAEELRHGTYAISAPTNHVEKVCGRPPEDFETTARRYIANPRSVFPGLTVGSKLSALGRLLRTVVTPAPRLDRWEQARGYPLIDNGTLAHDCGEWMQNATRGRLTMSTANSHVSPHDQDDRIQKVA